MKVIYSIINLKAGKQYIGSTTNFSRRKSRHLAMLRNGIHHSLSLQQSWNKNTPEDYKFVILEELKSVEDRFEREQYYMDFYKSYNKNHGYNMSKIARGTLSDTNIKDVYQFNLSGKLLNVFSNCVEAAEKLNIDNSGLSKCARGKYRFYGGYIWSYDSVLSSERIRLANEPIKRSEESKNKMSISAKNRTDLVKPILQYDLDDNLIKEWASTTELVKETKYSNGYISDCLHGKHSKAYGYKWKFKV